MLALVVSLLIATIVPSPAATRESRHDGTWRVMVPEVTRLDARDTPLVSGLVVGTSRYRLVQRNTTEISGLSTDAPSIQREFLLTMQVSVGDNGLMNVFIRVDSAVMDVNGLRQLTEFVGSGWRGRVTADGYRVSGGLVNANGEPTTASEMSPLLWMLPRFRSGSADTVTSDFSAASGPTRRLTAMRTFDVSASAIAVDGTVSTTLLGATLPSGAKIQLTSSGTVKGAWALTPSGDIAGGSLALVTSERYVTGSTTFVREDRISWTLTRII